MPLPATDSHQRLDREAAAADHLLGTAGPFTAFGTGRRAQAGGEDLRPRARAGNTAKRVGPMIKALKTCRLALVAPVLVAFGVAACSDTWEGMKEDTRENVQTTGEGIEKAGENIKKQTQ
jgi:predicted small secreted protein